MVNLRGIPPVPSQCLSLYPSLVILLCTCSIHVYSDDSCRGGVINLRQIPSVPSQCLSLYPSLVILLCTCSIHVYSDDSCRGGVINLRQIPSVPFHCLSLYPSLVILLCTCSIHVCSDDSCWGGEVTLRRLPPVPLYRYPSLALSLGSSFALAASTFALMIAGEEVFWFAGSMAANSMYARFLPTVPTAPFYLAAASFGLAALLFA